MTLHIRNARILTLAAASGAEARRGKVLGDLGVVPAGDVVVTEGRIAAVGPGLTAPADATVIEANGRVLIPPFVD